MKKKKNLSYIILIALNLLILTACSSPKQNEPKESKTTTSKTAASKSKKEQTKSSAAKEKMPEMNFSQIKKGDYSSIEGTWNEVAHGVNHIAGKSGTQYQIGGTGTLSVSKEKISTTGVSVVGQTLTDNNGDHKLTFKEENNTLIASLDNESVAINWAVRFYPKGTTKTFKTDSNSETNTEDLIVIWTSNNNFTVVFTQKPIDIETSENGLNVEQLANNDLSSLVGTWKNPMSGDTMVITDQIQEKPSDSNLAFEMGAVLKDTERNGYPTVIAGGSIRDGYIIGSIGTFDPEIIMSSFSPIAIIPRNVKMTDSDDSDSTKDRLIKGAGQGGFGTEAYYKE